MINIMRLASGNAAWQRLIRTPTFKYSMVFAILISFIALLVFSTLYFSMYQTLQNEVKERLTTEMVFHKDYFERHNRLASFKARDITIKLTQNHTLSPKLRRTDNFKFYAPNNFKNQPAFVNSSLNKLFNKHYLLVQPVDENRLIIIGKPINDRDFLHALIKGAITLFLVTLGLLILLSYIVGIRELRAVDMIRSAANNIMNGDLSKRIPVNYRQKGEIRQLSITLNEMLDRNEQLVIELQQVTNNIAHDLKSPINRIRSRMEVALLKDHEPEYYREKLGKSIEDIDLLIHIFNSLLSIAKIDAGEAKKDFTTFNLSHELVSIIDIFIFEAEAKQQTFSYTIAPNIIVFAHKNLLFQAISNLLNNAIKYTPPHGEINFTAKLQDNKCLIKISDTGIGIPSHLRESVFKRFYRVDVSRNLPGTGLGLSLVRSIVNLHQGKIELTDNEASESDNRGLTVTLTLNTSSA